MDAELRNEFSAPPADFIRAASEAVEALVRTSDERLRFTQHDIDARRLFAAFFYARTTRFLSATTLLAGVDHGIEAQALLRLLIEDMIEVRYVATEPEELAQRWLDHQDRTRYYAWTEQFGSDPDMYTPEQIARMEALIDRDVEEARESVGDGNPDRIAGRILKRRWTNRTMLRRAQVASKRFPDTLDHHVFYRMLCDAVHASAGLMNDYIVAVDGRPSIRMRADGYKSTTVGVLALHYASLTIEALSEFGLENAPDIAAIATSYIDFDAYSFDDLIHDQMVERDSAEGCDL